jgi:hypothetical protein
MTPDYAEVLAALARRGPKGKPITYRGGAGGLGNPDATLCDCPCCGQAVRVDLHGNNLSAKCYGGCYEHTVLARLNVARIVAELAARR